MQYTTIIPWQNTPLTEYLLDRKKYFDNYRRMESDSESEPIDTALEAIAATFAALGQPSRLRIVRLLLSAYPQGLPAGEIQKELGIAAPTLSHHLDKLRQVGVVTAQKDRQWIWYSVSAPALRQLLDFLFEECCTRNSVIVLEGEQGAAWARGGQGSGPVLVGDDGHSGCCES